MFLECLKGEKIRNIIGNKTNANSIIFFQFFVAVIFCYLIPFEEQYEYFRVRIFMLMAFIVFTSAMMINRGFLRHFNYNYILGGMFFILVLIAGEDYVPYVLGFSFLIYISALSNITFVHDKTMVFYLMFIAFIAFVLQIGAYPSPHIRAVTSIGDPNFSSYYLLLLFFLAKKLENHIFIIFSVGLGFVFLSKNFFLAIVVYYISFYFKDIIFFYTRKYDLKVGFYFVTSHLLLLLIAVICESMVGDNAVSPDGIARLFNFSNESDIARLTLNVNVVNEVFSDVVADLGLVFGVWFFMNVISVINKVFTVENVPYVLSYISFGLFLHASYSLFPFVIFYYILSVKFKDE